MTMVQKSGQRKGDNFATRNDVKDTCTLQHRCWRMTFTILSLHRPERSFFFKLNHQTFFRKQRNTRNPVKFYIKIRFWYLFGDLFKYNENSGHNKIDQQMCFYAVFVLRNRRSFPENATSSWGGCVEGVSCPQFKELCNCLKSHWKLLLTWLESKMRSPSDFASISSAFSLHLFLF